MVYAQKIVAKINNQNTPSTYSIVDIELPPNEKGYPYSIFNLPVFEFFSI